MMLAEELSLTQYTDLLELTSEIRLEREKKLAAERGEVHPEERKEAEKALDQTLENLGAITIDGKTFNQFQPVQAPVSRRRGKDNQTSGTVKS